MEIYSYEWLSKTKEVNRFISRVYNWMILAMILSAASAFGVAVLVATNLALWQILYSFYFLFIIIEIGLVVWLAAWIKKMSSTVASLLFIVYSIVNWITLSVIFLAYNPLDIVLAFLISSSVFLAMSLYWYKTESDLTSFWKLMMFWLFWVIVAIIVNFFLGSSLLWYIVSCVSVVVFTWLIAYDTQKLKLLWEMWLQNKEDYKKYAIVWALELYLDFVNLFLSILRLMWWRD